MVPLYSYHLLPEPENFFDAKLHPNTLNRNPRISARTSTTNIKVMLDVLQSVCGLHYARAMQLMRQSSEPVLWLTHWNIHMDTKSDGLQNILIFKSDYLGICWVSMQGKVSVYSTCLCPIESSCNVSRSGFPSQTKNGNVPETCFRYITRSKLQLCWYPKWWWGLLERCQQRPAANPRTVISQSLSFGYTLPFNHERPSVCIEMRIV